MLKLSALVTTLVLGASSAAMADPDVTVRGELRWGQPDRPVRVYERDRGYRRPYHHNTWVALTTPMQLGYGRTVVDVHERRPFTQLRLQTTNGASRIDRVIVRFENGGRQVIDVNQRLSPRNPMINIDLNGQYRRIDRIVVMGDSRRGGAVQVFGI